MSVLFSDWTPFYYTANESACKLLLENDDCMEKIVSLNSAMLHDIRDGQLVRFRGMIQDMHDPEYYLERYEVKNRKTEESVVLCGMYMDSAKCTNDESECIQMDSEKNKMSERHTWIVISTPGLNDWAKEKTLIRTRKIENKPNAAPKRELCNDEAMDCSEPSQKREKTENIVDSGEKNISNLSREHIMNFPIPNDDGKACIVKIYDEKISCKLNEIVDIIGFVSLDPALSRIHINDDTSNDPEIQTHNPPASMVPRLHAIKIIVEKTENSESIKASTILTKAASVRSDLHMILSQLLFGDNLAADYLICHLISAVYTRKDMLCLGNFPINITNFPHSKYKTFAKDFYQIIASLVPKSHYLKITLESLNDMSLIPKKDYECNRLTSGILQLSKNTHLVIDETGLTTGQVTPIGQKNYEAISEMIKYQKVNYDFKYFNMEYETDIPVFILSEVKSFIPCPTQIPLEIDPETEDLYSGVVEAANQYLRDEERLKNIRDYLGTLRNAEFEFDEVISDVIQVDFVNFRQKDKNFCAENLHSLMVLARLMSLSRGSKSLSLDCWKETVKMELERIERLPNRNK